MNIVEFIIKLNDGYTLPLGKVTKSNAGASYTFDQLAEANKKLQGAVGKTSGSMGDLRAKITKLKEMREIIPSSAGKHLKDVTSEIHKLQAELDKLEGKKIESKGLFSGFSDAIPPILKNPLTLIGAGAAALVNRGMKNSQTKLDFQLMLGNDSGDQLFAGLKKIKPLLGGDTIDFGKQLLENGVSAQKVVPMLTSIGEVAAGNKAKLGVLTGAFSDMQKEGKLTESVMAQMESGGFKPLVVMSQTTGISLQKLRSRLEEGKISIEDVTKALQSSTGPGGQFYGNLEKISNSPMGGWNTLIEKVSEFADKLADKLMPIASVVIDYMITGFDILSGALSTVVGWLQPLAIWAQKNSDILMLFGSVIGGVAFSIKAITVAKTVWAAVTGGLTTVMGALNAVMLMNPIGIVIGLIAGLVAGVIYAWNKFEGFRKAMYGVWETVKSVFTSIGNLFKQIFSPIGEAITAFKEGRYMDAAKAAGKLVFNLTPMGIVKNVVEFSKGGGFDDVGQSYSRGAAKGAKSWADSQAEKAAGITGTDKAFGMSDDDKAKYLQKRDTSSTAKAKEGINAISGGGIKNITVTIGKMIDGGITVHLQNGTKQMAQEIERLVEESMVRAIASATNRG